VTAIRDPSGPEAKIQFLMALRSQGFRDTALLRAFETVPRTEFVSRRYADLALADMTLPIGCGQTIAAPTVLARMVSALSLSSESRVLEIGTGTGYSTMILSRLCREVVSLERFRSLAAEAESRLAVLGVANAGIVHGDGLAIRSGTRFDRIFIDASFDSPPANLAESLEADGVMVGVRRTAQGGRLAVYARNETGLTETLGVPISLPQLMAGASAAL
jgi:protein-L-isoaspartate(D-aspartate) O-methyltransferase